MRVTGGEFLATMRLLAENLSTAGAAGRRGQRIRGTPWCSSPEVEGILEFPPRGAELVVDVPQVVLHGLGGDEEPGSGLTVGRTRGDGQRDLEFLRGEQVGRRLMGWGEAQTARGDLGA